MIAQSNLSARKTNIALAISVALCKKKFTTFEVEKLTTALLSLLIDQIGSIYVAVIFIFT